MNGAHFHLIVNHFPIIFPIVGIIVLIIGMLSKSEPIKRTAYFIFFLTAMASVIAMNSGEQAEEVVENLSGVSKSHTHDHEEAAEIFALLTYILGAISLVAIWVSIKNLKINKMLTIILFAFSIIVLYFGKETGTTGGEIRHTEIRSDFRNDNKEIINNGNNMHDED